MKKILFLLSAAVTGVSVFADDWTYNPEVKCVSDNIWTFSATDNGSGGITFNRVQQVPGAVSPLDFSKPVKDVDGNSMTIVSIDRIFGYFNQTMARWDESNLTEERKMVGVLTLPGEGLLTVGNSVFRDCINATGEIVIPQSVTKIDYTAFYNSTGLTIHIAGMLTNVTSIGDDAFNGVDVIGDVSLPAIKTISIRAFRDCKHITSVSCGPDLTTVKGKWTGGWLFGCSGVTNVTIDPAANVSFNGGADFQDCTSLKEIDLSCAVALKTRDGNTIQSYPTFGGCTSLKKVVFSSKLKTLDRYVFNGASVLEEVHFFGPPPTELDTPVFYGAASGRSLVTYVHLDEDSTEYNYAAAKAAWDALTAGGSLEKSGSTWSSAMVGNSYADRALLLYEEFVPGQLGYWVYDDRGEVPVVSNGVWTFLADRNALSVIVKECVKWPTELSELDFTKSLTDTLGKNMSFLKLLTAFSTSKDNPTEAAQYVGRLALPAEGVNEIGAWAFADCTHLTEVSNCIPDSVTTLGYGAFHNVPLSDACGAVRLYGVTGVVQDIFSGCTHLGSLVFGPGLKSMESRWNAGAFNGCNALSNVVFDAAMSNCTFNTCSVWGPFVNCPSLHKLDLRGFADLFVRDSGTIGGDLHEVIIGDNIKTLHQNAIKGSSLTNVTFLGRPPQVFDGPYLGAVASAKKQKVVTYVLRKQKAEPNTAGMSWLDYAANGRILHKGTTWASDYIGTADESDRPLLTVEPDGLMLIVK